MILRIVGNFVISRNLCKITESAKTPSPTKITTNMIGPVDPVSNLREIVYHEAPDETPLEKEFRIKRIEVQMWNQQFWKLHNTNFFQEKEKYIKKNITTDQQTLNPDEISVFYKAFLDKNWRTHVEYNKQWYQKNISLLLLGAKVKIYKFLGKNWGTQD